MIKTIITIPNFSYNVLSTAIHISNQTDQWFKEGRHSNNVKKFMDAQATFTIERWSWINEEVALEYKDFCLEHLGKLFPGVTCEIVNVSD